MCHSDTAQQHPDPWAPTWNIWHLPCHAQARQIFFPLICFRHSSHKPHSLAPCFHVIRPAQRRAGIHLSLCQAASAHLLSKHPQFAPLATQNHLPALSPPPFQPQLPFSPFWCLGAAGTFGVTHPARMASALRALPRTEAAGKTFPWAQGTHTVGNGALCSVKSLFSCTLRHL